MNYTELLLLLHTYVHCMSYEIMQLPCVHGKKVIKDVPEYYIVMYHYDHVIFSYFCNNFIMMTYVHIHVYMCLLYVYQLIFLKVGDCTYIRKL